MKTETLSKHDIGDISIYEDGTFYNNKTGRTLGTFYRDRIYVSVPPIGRVRADFLMAALFIKKYMPDSFKHWEISYKDGDPKNIAVDNLIFTDHRIYNKQKYNTPGRPTKQIVAVKDGDEMVGTGAEIASILDRHVCTIQQAARNNRKVLGWTLSYK